MKKTSILACILCLSGCSSSNNGDGQDAGPKGLLRYQTPTPGPNVDSTPRAHPTCQMRQHGATFRSPTLKSPWELHGRLRSVSALNPGDPVPKTGIVTLRRALAVRLPKSFSAYEPGCADGIRNGFLNPVAFPDIAACWGSYGLNHINSPEANALCAPGWHVCSPVNNPTDSAIIGSLTYLDATLPGACYSYNAAQNGNACIECTGDPGAREMAGVGMGCTVGTYDPDGSGCTADGRVDSLAVEGDTSYACGGSRTDGVVCCSDGNGTGSTPTECPRFAPGQDQRRNLADCGDYCLVTERMCPFASWPDGYPVHCSRDGFDWACLDGATCDMTTPIDFYEMLYATETYCVFDPDACPPEFPDACGGVCCRTGATCLFGTHCAGVCPPGYSVDCQRDGVFSQCCLDGTGCGLECSCPLSMTSCDDVCCPGGQVCQVGTCYIHGCDPAGEYPEECEDICCLPGTTNQCDPMTGAFCGCPPNLPLECGDYCCSAGSTCDNGTCIPPCGGDYTLECLTDAQELLCCLDGSTCQTDGCDCPPDLPVECNRWCAEAGTEYIDGGCYIPECDYGLLCGDLCCDGVECIQPGECGCPEDYPVPCGDMCCLDDCTCDPLDCTNGCSGDFPDYCATGWSGAECCRAGAECRDPGGCACPADYPVECDQYCCPERTRCNLDNCVPMTCPDTHPLVCGDFCCLEDAECLAGDQCSCTDSNPVECDAWCCPQGWLCGDSDPTGMRRCVKPTDPDGDCPGGWMGSTRSYGAVGTSDACRGIGETNICITKEMYEQGTGLPFPASCAPEDTTGCINNQGILVKPCCPGLTCYYRERCGGPSNGQCKP